ncbi:type VI secretion system accessory protein TagJ [Thalassomonas actiniarum]|uniref:Virulence protein, SciE type n=1 Tax=Thalassomonas actiniarum TaxID=485447 RepID=A0AAF0C5R5_9GAMM|nr:type VI secretion system accessory protein TagJ [Thalassomonas actiniarum]WDE01185.1 virulence protein, SciE type [Thalassomonas actiniarum]
MKEIKSMLQQGRLTDVISHIETQLRDDPLNVDLKSALVELLCINGELERADQLINAMVQKHPDLIVGASNLRLLIRAAQERQDFLQGQGVPNLFNERDEYLEAFMKLNLEINQGQQGEALQQVCEQLERSRPDTRVKINDSSRKIVRDLDDTLGGFIEIFGTDGKFYIAQLAEVDYVHFKPVSSLLEQVWRRVDLSIKGGPSGEAYLPLVYANSVTDKQKLGRETDWQQLAPEVSRGAGQKMWFVDDKAMAISEVNHINCVSLEGEAE